MTENIPQTSASERIEVARKVLTNFDGRSKALGPSVETLEERRLSAALRSLITPPAVGESEEAIAERIADDLLLDTDCYADKAVHSALVAAVRAGIQSAHESWEPADVPSQEFMLGHLGLDYKESTDDEGEPSIYVFGQHIEKEGI